MRHGEILFCTPSTPGARGAVFQILRTPSLKKQWDVKREFAVNAEKQSEALLGEALHSYTTGGNVSVVA
jgi:hypothetical protein